MDDHVLKRIVNHKEVSDGHGIFRRDRYLNAAVLIPFVKHQEAWYVLLQKRAKDIRQGGEICFPGGGHEKQDSSFMETAIRETIEEIGITRQQIQVFGKLDTYIGRSGVIIEPFIAQLTIDDLHALEPDHREVEKLLLVPLIHFMNHEPQLYHIQVEQASYIIDEDGQHKTLLPVKELGLPNRYAGTWGTSLHEIYVYDYQGELIWGITADILYDVVKKMAHEIENEEEKAL